MPFSTSAAFSVIIAGVLVMTGIAVTAGHNGVEPVRDAELRTLLDDREQLGTRIEIVAVSYFSGNDIVLFELRNTGSRTLSVDATDVVLDNTHSTITSSTDIRYPSDATYGTSYNVSRRGQTDLWHPGEVLFVRIDGVDATRGKIVTEHGVAVSRTIEDRENPVYHWPTFGQNPANEGHHSNISGPTGPSVEPRWTYKLDRKTESSPIVATELLSALHGRLERTVFVGDDSGYVYAINTSDGSGRWNFSTGATVKSTPTVYRDTIFIGNDNGTIYALDWATGNLRWTVDTGDSIISGTTVRGETLYAGSWDSHVYAIDIADGSIRWRTNLGGQVHGTPAVADGLVYASGKQDKAIRALYASNGSVVWRVPLEQIVTGAAVSDGVVYIGTFSADRNVPSRLYALNATTGGELWRYQTDDQIKVSPAVTASTVYVADESGVVYAVNRSDGTERWTTTIGSVIHSSPAVASNTVYLGANDGYVYAFNATDGSQRWSYSVGGAVRPSPAVLNGTVYVGSTRRVVAALNDSTW